jgi:hypothetical protein
MTFRVCRDRPGQRYVIVSELTRIRPQISTTEQKYIRFGGTALVKFGEIALSRISARRRSRCGRDGREDGDT